MITGNHYSTSVQEYFAFLVSEFQFKLFDISTEGNLFYDVQYKKGETVISVSYENMENYLLVLIYTMLNGEPPHYDDKLNNIVLREIVGSLVAKLDKVLVEKNNKLFSKFHPQEGLQRELLKNAKELNLYLTFNKAGQ